FWLFLGWCLPTSLLQGFFALPLSGLGLSQNKLNNSLAHHTEHRTSEHPGTLAFPVRLIDNGLRVFGRAETARWTFFAGWVA
ncbi:MAG: hypothetical protein ACHRHE_13500, partial [Tepidisphaerales bacterium]